MKKNIVKSIINKKGNLVLRFFDNEGKLKEKSLGMPDTKANRSEAKKSIREFEAWLREKAKDAVEAAVVSKIPLNFGYYSDKYLQQLKDTGHSKLVAYSYRITKMKTHFGSETDINSITELAIEEFFQGLSCTRATKIDWLVVLRGILEKARKGNAVAKNLASNFKLPAEATISNTEAVEPFTPDEMKSLLVHSQGSVLHNYLGIAFHLGTRPEETIALKTNDIDLDNGIVHIERAITKGQCKATKTKSSVRSIPLPKQAIIFFENQMLEAKQKKSLFLFSKENGTRLDDIEDLRGKKNRNGPWYQLLEKAKVAERKLMQTRHTFAVQAIKSGAYTLQEVSSILGHTSLEMLFSHYGKHLGNSHLKVDRSIDIFSGLGDFLGDFRENEKN